MNAKVSVIIHFLNADRYLATAIESVQRQTLTDWELILVDGGSSDRSLEIARQYQNQAPEQVQVLAHSGEPTLGIFSSRIWGAKAARTPILALLDSDDEWHPQFLERQYGIYQAQFPTTPGMVYCPVTYWWEDPSQAGQSYVQPVPPSGLHQPPELLIPMAEDGYQKSAANSSVMIGREIILAAETLIGTADEGMVEDQFLWSLVTLQYPIFVNPEPLVRYRQWDGSTCATTIQAGKADQLRQRHLTWLAEYLATSYQGDRQGFLQAQVQYLLTAATPGAIPPSPPPSALDTYKAQIQQVAKNYLSPQQFDQAQQLYRKAFQLTQVAQQSARQVAQLAIDTAKVVQSRSRLAVGQEPLSYLWGHDRGVPLDRYYLSLFLQTMASDIKGHCLEFQENSYTSMYGGARVGQIDILDLSASNPQATLIADLTQPNTLPDNQFDCIICTHVLHVIFELEAAIATLYRMLKPGGVLLVAVPHVSMCDPNAHELWRFTPEGLRRCLTTAFQDSLVIVQAYGNSLTAAGELRGLVAHEFSPAELNYHDPRFAVEICARAVKQP